MPSTYYSVAIAGPFLRCFTYASERVMQPGQRVVVPFGARTTLGIVVATIDAAHGPVGMTVKSITNSLDDSPAINQSLLTFCLWIADYYLCNPADPLLMTLPPSYRQLKALRTSSAKSRTIRLYRLTDEDDEFDRFRAARKQKPARFDGALPAAKLALLGWTKASIAAALEQGILILQEAPSTLSQASLSSNQVSELRLTKSQQSVLDAIEEQVKAGFGVSLVHGVTGSGKTLIYCHAARQVVEAGGSVLMLTPEIALTGSFLAYAKAFFGDRVAVIHSAMSDSERMESWQGIVDGRFRVVIGPRSALFAPLEQIGLIIVDEEHDPSYKQDDPSPRFHGRDAAIMRAKMANCPVILGSASPSVESYYQAKEKKYRLLELQARATGASMPHVELIDLKSQRLSGDLQYLSFPLKQSVERTIASGEQAILFLNRRGFSRQLKCDACGHTVTCPSCSIPYTYHKKGNKVACHYCGKQAHVPEHCPLCKSDSLGRIGAGTQRVEEDIARLFPSAKTVRFDADTTRSRGKPDVLLEKMQSGKANLLLGTQMVTKGLDLPNVTLVGVLSADQGLDQPDFRAGEKTFARLLQVAGRSGRSSKPGRVLIQTWLPDHPVIKAAAQQNYHALYEMEIAQRKLFDYPPFCRLVNVMVAGKHEAAVAKSIRLFRDELLARTSAATLPITLLGPAPCAQYLLGGLFRQHLLVKTNQMTKLVRLFHDWDAATPRLGIPSSLRLTIDIDPVEMG